MSSQAMYGLKFQLSEVFLIHHKIELPQNLDLKEPDIILKECEYDFSLEQIVIDTDRVKQHRLREEERKKQEILENKLLSGNRNEDERRYDTPNVKQKSSPKSSSYDDEINDSIFTPTPDVPQPADEYDQWKCEQLGQQNLEVENESPVEDRDLNDIDSLKELESVVRDIQSNRNVSKIKTVSNPVPRARRRSPAHVEEVSIKRTEHARKKPSKKTLVVDELTDLLTADVKYTEDTPQSQTVSSIKHNVSQSRKNYKDSYIQSTGDITNVSVATHDMMPDVDAHVSTSLPFQSGKDVMDKPSVIHATAGEPNPVLSNSDIHPDLSPDELNFIQSCVSLGYRESDVIRTMRKHGKNHKQVLDHLQVVYRLSEEGFETDNIEEALELFNGTEEEARPYLALEHQFMTMGFSRGQIKQAFLLHKHDPNKVLDVLMSGS